LVDGGCLTVDWAWADGLVRFPVEARHDGDGLGEPGGTTLQR